MSAHPSGVVDVESDIKQTQPMLGSHLMMQELSRLIEENPTANRFQVSSDWGDCGVEGRKVFVYNREAGTLTAWDEVRNYERLFPRVTHLICAPVRDGDIYSVAKTDPSAQRMKTGKPFRLEDL
jgi:hypothetical protein